MRPIPTPKRPASKRNLKVHNAASERRPKKPPPHYGLNSRRRSTPIDGSCSPVMAATLAITHRGSSHRYCENRKPAASRFSWDAVSSNPTVRHRPQSGFTIYTM